MKSNKNLEYRMYFLTPYNLSSIQAGIQQIHGVVEYSLLYGNDVDYLKWANNWKTVIVLNGGTSNNLGYHHYQTDTSENNSEYIGSMELYRQKLEQGKIKHSTFYEPDANNMLTSIAFLCDERVFKKYSNEIDDIFYPDFEQWMSIEKSIFKEDTSIILDKDHYPAEYKQWLDWIGGPKNAFLRSFISGLKLANN